MTGSSVVAIKYKDGILMAVDMRGLIFNRVGSRLLEKELLKFVGPSLYFGNFCCACKTWEGVAVVMFHL